MNEWVSNQVLEFSQLTGRRTSSFDGVEMAIRVDDGTGVPQFFDKSVPCLQFSVLYVHFDDGAVAAVGTYQDNDEFGLCVDWRAPPLDAGCEGIFRFREVPELGVGLVGSVTTTLSSRGNLSEVGIFVADREIRLVAGEIYENFDDSLTFCRDDAHVLIFPNSADVAAISWIG